MGLCLCFFFFQAEDGIRDADVTGVQTCALPILAARKVSEAVQTAVRAATSLTCSLGVSTSKVVAKIASDHRKPAGLTVVPPGGEASFLSPFDVRRLPGVGPKAEQRLGAAGVATI